MRVYGKESSKLKILVIGILLQLILMLEMMKCGFLIYLENKEYINKDVTVYAGGGGGYSTLLIHPKKLIKSMIMIFLFFNFVVMTLK